MVKKSNNNNRKNTIFLNGVATLHLKIILFDGSFNQINTLSFTKRFCLKVAMFGNFKQTKVIFYSNNNVILVIHFLTQA